MNKTKKKLRLLLAYPAERGWRDWSASYIKYRGQESIGYGIEFTRRLITKMKSYEYKTTRQRISVSRPIGITEEFGTSLPVTG